MQTTVYKQVQLRKYKVEVLTFMVILPVINTNNGNG